MYKEKHMCEITEKKEIAPNIIDMRIYSPDIAKQARPGQFLNIKCSDGLENLLRRPISICDIDKETHEVRFVFQVRGEGTLALAEKYVGDKIDILGPLGNPYKIIEKYKKPTLIGGGIGVFPLLLLSKELSSFMNCFKGESSITAYLGFRNKDAVVLENDFSSICDNLLIYTDDGSYGQSGVATKNLENDINEGKTDIVYACGPVPMLKTVKLICEKYKIPCQISMEQRMGCGIGACLVCVCKIKKGDDWDYGRICKEGPVFWADEVILDD